MHIFIRSSEKNISDEGTKQAKPQNKKVRKKEKIITGIGKIYSYAHSQEIFKECPTKLAEVVGNNDLA